MTHIAILAMLLVLAAPQEAPKSQRVSGGVLAGKAIDKPQPVYPEMAKAAGIEGAVVVEVTLDEQGYVISARAVSGHPLLREAAVEAARGWRFSPTTLEGAAVKVIGTLTFNFKLTRRPAPEEVEPSEVEAPPIGVTTEKLYERQLVGSIPDYPAEAERAGVEGMVQVRVVVSADGQVVRADAISGPEALHEASVRAAERWRFRPIVVDGKALVVESDMYFRFDRGASSGRPVLENGEEYRPDEAPAGVPGGVPGEEYAEPPPPPPDVAPPPASSDRPKVTRVSGGVLAGRAVRRAQPEYPLAAREAEIEGAVVVEVTVDEEGNVISARAVSGHPLLRDAAVQAARGWKFTPTMLQGVAVKVIGTITFNFRKG